MIQIAIADDHTLFKQGLAELIDAEPDLQILFHATDGHAFLENVETGLLPDIALVDLDMPGMNGLALTIHLRKHYSTVRVIILTAYTQERFMMHLLEAGARAFLSKSVATDILFAAIRQVYLHGYYIDEPAFQAMQKKAFSSQPLHVVNRMPVALSKRETEVLRLICLQQTAQEMAEQLFVSVRTIEGHRNNLLLKTGCKNTAGLVMFAIRHQLVDPL